MKEQPNKKCSARKTDHGRHRWWHAVAAIVIGVLLVVGLWYLLRSGEEEPSSFIPDPTQSSSDTTLPSGEEDRPITPDHSTQPSGETVPDEVPQTSEDTHPTEDTQSTEDIQSTEDMHPSEVTQPTEENPQEGTEPSTQDRDDPVSDGYTSFIQGISVSPVEKYTGMYMEDGSGEIVSDIMMVIVRNDTSSDLQLARIEVQYSEFTAQFQVTNLPAGQSAVVLEKSRKAFTKEEYRVMNLYDVVFFQEKMSLCPGQVKVSGSKGTLEIENISSETFGVVYVYFKNVAADGLLHGGITYRTTFEAGLEPGKSMRVKAGHYDPDFTTIMLVQIAENVT